jgi:hypothetical protein
MASGIRVVATAVPIETRRRAARFLESVHGSPMAPEGNLRFGGECCPMYRPDIGKVAYWEFEVLGVPSTDVINANGKHGRGESGFMVLSAGPHDTPVPHFSLELAPPSRRLEAAVGPGQIARVFKLDSLCYAAEDRAGKLLGHLGNFPPRISELPREVKDTNRNGSAEAAPTAPAQDDERPIKLKLTRTGSKPPHVTLADWDSWEQTKKEYAGTYRLFLEALTQSAAEAWEIEHLAAKFGEGIHEGDIFSVRLLRGGKAFVRGKGASAVTLRMDEERDPPAITIAAGSSRSPGEVAFELVIDYDDRTQEVLPFFMVPRGTPSNYRSDISSLGLPVEGPTQ